jgi:hypothetical protein
MKRILSVAALALAGTLAAGCGGGTSAPVASSRTSAPVVNSATSAPAANSGNALVCQHFRAQLAWKEHLTFPTLADAFKYEGYVAADDAEATGKLRHDLDGMLAKMQGKKSSYVNGTVTRYCHA